MSNKAIPKIPAIGGDIQVFALVHPAHARKMVAKLEALGHQPLYYENVEGGHGGAADVKQRAYVDALVYTFLASKLGLGAYQASAAAPK
jgi:prolyl oligopeptidase